MTANQIIRIESFFIKDLSALLSFDYAKLACNFINKQAKINLILTTSIELVDI